MLLFEFCIRVDTKHILWEKGIGTGKTAFKNTQLSTGQTFIEMDVQCVRRGIKGTRYTSTRSTLSAFPLRCPFGGRVPSRLPLQASRLSLDFGSKRHLHLDQLRGSRMTKLRPGQYWLWCPETRAVGWCFLFPDPLSPRLSCERRRQFTKKNLPMGMRKRRGLGWSYWGCRLHCWWPWR